MLTRSGAPDFICLAFDWRIHFAMSFLPLLSFRRQLTKCDFKSSVGKHVSMSVIVLARGGFSLRSGAVGPFLMLCRVLSCFSWTHALWFLRMRDVAHLMWCECSYCYQCCQKMDNGLLDIDFDCLTSDSLSTNISFYLGKCSISAIVGYVWMLIVEVFGKCVMNKRYRR